MKKYVLPLVCVTGALVPWAATASMARSRSLPSATHFLGYFQQDADSDVETDSDSDGTYDVFYDRLAPEGHWLNDDDYGYVWQPNVAVSEASWRPYSDGHWVWTDRGWYWDSNENFGWATYHYGRWVLVEGTGWVWVPGQRWAPAWVSWRHTGDDDYVGWAPLPPESSFRVDVGVHPWCDSYYDIGPTAFGFIRIGDFGRPSYRQYFLPEHENLGFFNRTTNITNVTYNNNVINNYGPQYERVSRLVQQRGGQQIPSYKINYTAQTRANAAFKASAQGNQLNIAAPPQTLKPIATVRPQVAKELGKTQVNRGWRNVPDAQAQQLRQQFAQQTPVPKNLPAKPVFTAKPQIQAATKGEQRPPNEPGKVPKASDTQLKPFVQKPEDETGEQKRFESEKAKRVPPETAKPGEPPKKTEVVTEEKRPGTESTPTEKPGSSEARKGEGQHPPQNLKTRHVPKPAGHEESPNRKKEDIKNEPATPPQTKVNHQIERHEPQVAEAHAAQPHAAQPHAAQPHAVQPHAVTQAHPKSGPPAQAHKAASKGGQKKKEEHNR